MMTAAILSTALQALGLTPGPGAARFNGVPVAVEVAADTRTPAEVFAALAKSLDGKLTVTIVGGTFAMVADIRSTTCLPCRVPTLQNLDQIQRETYSVGAMVLPNGQTLVIGAESGKIAEAMAKRRGPLAYEGTELTAAFGDWKIESQTSYEFNGTTVRTTLAETLARPEAVRAALRASLEKNGYRGMRGGESPAVEPWVKDDTMIAFAVEAGATTRIFVHEAVSP